MLIKSQPTSFLQVFCEVFWIQKFWIVMIFMIWLKSFARERSVLVLLISKNIICLCINNLIIKKGAKMISKWIRLSSNCHKECFLFPLLLSKHIIKWSSVMFKPWVSVDDMGKQEWGGKSELAGKFSIVEIIVIQLHLQWNLLKTVQKK